MTKEEKIAALRAELEAMETEVDENEEFSTLNNLYQHIKYERENLHELQISYTSRKKVVAGYDHLLREIKKIIG